MKLKRFKSVIFFFKDSSVLKIENIVSVFSHEKMLEIIDDKDKVYCILLESLDYYQVENLSEEKMDDLYFKHLEKQREPKERMTIEELDKITCYIKDNIMRNEDILFNYDARVVSIEDDNKLQDIDLLDVIASLHNMLYKEVTGKYYDYMFHWANKVGSWVYDDLFKKEEEKRERN